VPDAASIAAMRFLQTHTGIRAGGSTGTNLYGALRIACEMRAARQAGSIVTLMCDPRERYVRTYADDRWLAEQGLELDAYLDVLDRAWTTGEWTG
jgi:cysteine synthase A